MANPLWQNFSQMAVPNYDQFNPAAQGDIDPLKAYEHATVYNKMADELNSTWGNATALGAGSSGFKQSPYKTYFEYLNDAGQTRYLVPQQNLGLNAQGLPEVNFYQTTVDGDSRYAPVGVGGVARTLPAGMNIPGLEQTPGFTGFMEYVDRPQEVQWTKPKDEGILQSMAGGLGVLAPFAGLGGLSNMGIPGLSDIFSNLSGGAGGGAGAGGGSGGGGGMFDWLQNLFDAPVPGDAFSPGDLVSGSASNPIAGDAFMPGALAPSQGLGTVAGQGLSSSGLVDQLLAGYNPFTGNALSLNGAASAVNSAIGGGGSGFSGLGSILGGLLGSQNGSKQAGTTTTVEDIPEWQKALLMPAFAGASGLLSQQAGQTSPLIAPAQDQLKSTIQGDYLNSNPYLDKTFNMGADQIKERLSPSFGHMQAFGENSGWNQAYGKAMGDYATNLYGGNYQQERGRQVAAAGAAPGFSTAATSTAWDPFKNFMSVAGGKFGGSQSQPYFTNPLSGALSGALLGGKLFG